MDKGFELRRRVQKQTRQTEWRLCVVTPPLQTDERSYWMMKWCGWSLWCQRKMEWRLSWERVWWFPQNHPKHGGKHMQDSNKTTTEIQQNQQTTTNGLFNRSYPTGDLNNVSVCSEWMADYLLNKVFIILEKVCKTEQFMLWYIFLPYDFKIHFQSPELIDSVLHWKINIMCSFSKVFCSHEATDEFTILTDSN